MINEMFKLDFKISGSNGSKVFELSMEVSKKASLKVLQSVMRETGSYVEERTKDLLKEMEKEEKKGIPWKKSK